MSSPSHLDEKAGRRLKMGKTAPARTEDDPAAALAAVLGRPFPAIELFDHIADIVFFIKDREGRYVAVNQTLAERCNFADKRALIGRKASQVFPPPLGERFEAQDLKVIAEGLSIRGRMELHLYPDGSEGWCLSWKEPLVDAGGAIQGLAGISRDAPALSRPGSVPAALSAALPYIDDHPDEPLRIPDLAAPSRSVAVPVRPATSGSVRPLGWPIPVPAAHRTGVRPPPAYRGALERIGARTGLPRSGGVHPPVP